MLPDQEHRPKKLQETAFLGRAVVLGLEPCGVCRPFHRKSAQEPSTRVYASGGAFDVYRDLRKVLSTARETVFVVEPYADQEIFELYLAKVGETISIRLLTRPPSDALRLVAAKFASRPGSRFEARGTKKVHDRVIIVDSAKCWVIGQSIKDAAVEKPTYLVQVDSVTDIVDCYEHIWFEAKPY